VATALRLFTRAELARVIGHVLQLQRTLERRATGAGDAYMPGYTHLQRAQPVLLAHHLLAHGWALARDTDRMSRPGGVSTCRLLVPARSRVRH